MILGEISHHMGCSPCYLVFLGSQYELLLFRICFYFYFYFFLWVGGRGVSYGKWLSPSTWKRL
jgi:hypothetical protein